MKKQPHFSKADLKEIEEHIRRAELLTSGEIAVAIKQRSDAYAFVTWAWAAIGLGAATLAFWLIERGLHWAFPMWEVVCVQLTGALAGLVLSQIPAVHRLLISKKLVQEYVHKEALAHFLLNGLHVTRDRTGILIFISLLERMVEILADKGIDAKLGSGFWTEQVEHMIRGIHDGRAVKAICKSVDQMGAKLVELFPRRADDTNELSNTVQTDQER